MSLKQKTIQAVSVLLIFSIFFSAVPNRAEALIPVHDAPKTIIDKIFHGIQIVTEKLHLFSAGLPGSGAGARAVAKASKKPCEGLDATQKIADTADAVGGVEVISGSSAQLTKAATRLAALNVVRACYFALQQALDAGGSVAGVAGGSQVLEVLGTEGIDINAKLVSLDARIDDARKEMKAANVAMWKGIAIRILMNAQSRLATRLVNNLISKYKIGNVLQYVDAASTFIYTKDYIQKNFKENADKMIIRTILTNDGIGNKVLPIIRSKASRVLGFIPEEVSFSDPNYYVKLASAGSGQADPFLLQTVFQDQASEAKAAGDQAAKDEANSGEGFVPVRNCAGAVAQQADFDRMNVQYSYDVYDKEETLNRLKAQMQLNPEADPAEVDQAQKDLDDARKKLLSLPETNRPIVDLCDKIQNPGASVAKSINSYLTAHLGNASDVKPDNLPFFANFIEGVASNFVSSIIEGQKPGLNILTDAGIRSANIAATQLMSGITETKSLKAADVANNEDKIVFSAQKGSGANQYIFTWSLNGVDGASKIVISGPNFAPKTVSGIADTGTVTANLASGGTYTLIVYDVKNQMLGKKQTEVQFTPQTQVNLPNNGVVDESGEASLGEQVTQPQYPTDYNSCMTIGSGDEAQCRASYPPSEPAVTGNNICGGQFTSKAICLQQRSQADCDLICGSVNGAFISVPRVSIRGWNPNASYITPRSRME